MRKDDKRGFTLLEILIVISILFVVSGLGLFVSLDFARSNAVFSERDILLSILRTARLNAANNVYGTPHGVYVTSTEYVLFSGSSYATRDLSYDQAFEKSPAVAAAGLSEAVFYPLSATSSASGTITLSDDIRALEILINHEGMIDW